MIKKVKKIFCLFNRHKWLLHYQSGKNPSSQCSICGKWQDLIDGKWMDRKKAIIDFLSR
jgi:hypothetical protein